MPKWSPPSNFSIGYLENLAEGEAVLRLDRAIRRRIGKARFPVIKTLDHSDWSWPKKINRLLRDSSASITPWS